MERGDEIQMRFKYGLHSRWDPTLAPPAYIWVGLVEPRKALIVTDSDSD